MDSSISFASSHVAGAAGPITRSAAASTARTSGSGTCTSGRDRPSGRSAALDDVVVGQRLRPGQRELAVASPSPGGPAPPARNRPRPRPRWAGTRRGRRRTPASPAAATAARAATATGRPACRRWTGRTRWSEASLAATAAAALALLRMNRAPDWAVAPMAEKKTKRDAPARSAARTRRTVASPLSASSEPGGLVADRRAQVDHRVHPAEGVAEAARIGQVAQRQLHPHPVRSEPARIAHQAAHRLGPAVGQPPQHRAANRAGGSRE